MLEKNLSQQLENIQTLQEILEEEKRCLTEKDFSNFNSLLFDKQKSLQSIATLDKKLTTPKNLQAIAEHGALSTLKQTIATQLSACQKINDINGKLVERSMKSNKHLLQLLTQATGKESVTYDQKGLLQGGQLLGENIKA